MVEGQSDVVGGDRCLRDRGVGGGDVFRAGSELDSGIIESVDSGVIMDTFAKGDRVSWTTVHRVKGKIEENITFGNVASVGKGCVFVDQGKGTLRQIRIGTLRLQKTGG